MNRGIDRQTDELTMERTYPGRIQDIWQLWVTKDGFESWWGPRGFRAQVSELEAKEGGVLRYEMIASTPDMMAQMERLGQPAAHSVYATFSELQPHKHLVITHVIDFIPGVQPYRSQIEVKLTADGPHVKMSVRLDRMHDEATTRQQIEGFKSQLSKLDARLATSDG